MGSCSCVLGHRFDIALGDEQVGESVVVDVLELGVPAGRRHHIVPDEGSVRGHASPNRDVAVARLGRPVGEFPELVVALAGQEHLGKPVARDIVARDPHAPDLEFVPAVLSRVEAGRLPLVDPPELLLTVAVVVLVVRDPQVAPAGAVPVAEEDGERAPAGAQECRVRVGRVRPVGTCRLSEQSPFCRPVLVEFDVHADREGRHHGGALPGCAESCRPLVAAVEPERFVGALESAVAESAEEHVLAESEHGEIGVAVRIDVDRIGAGDLGQVGIGLRHLGELQRTSDGALVDVERGRIRPAGEVEILFVIVVAVEYGDAATHEVGPVPVVGVVNTRGLRFVDEARRPQCFGRGGRPARRQEHDGTESDHHNDGYDARR